MKRIGLAFACLLAVAIFTAQTTVLPKTAVFPKTVALTGSVANGTVTLGETSQNTLDSSGETNTVIYAAIISPPVTSTLTTMQMYWANVSANTWGTAIYSDTGAVYPGAKLCSALVTNTPSVGLNTLTPSGCGTIPANTILWMATMTGSATLSLGYNNTTCPQTGGLSLVSNSPEGSTVFPATAGATTGFSNVCYSEQATFTCNGASCYPASVPYLDNLNWDGSMTSGTSISWSHFTGSGTHPALTVQLQSEASLASATCTYNSVSMTRLWAIVDSANVDWNAFFILPAPATGTHTIACTVTSTTVVAGFSHSWIGVNQSTPNRTVTTATDGGTPNTLATVTCSNATSGDVVLDTFTSDTVSAMTETSNHQSVWQYSHISGVGISAGSAWANATGSTTMSWTLSLTAPWATGCVALIPG